jgi:hypothetical protein
MPEPENFPFDAKKAKKLDSLLVFSIEISDTP